MIVQNTGADMVSTISAGGDISYSGWFNAGGLQVAGPGFLVVQAGGNIGPFLPLVFRAQFGYCYSFCPEKMDAGEARALADDMRLRHKKESEAAWADAERQGVALTGVENKHENPALEVIAN